VLAVLKYSSAPRFDLEALATASSRTHTIPKLQDACVNVSNIRDDEGIMGL